MWVIVGLGNPGVEYAQTRHNAGFLVVDTLARRWGIPRRGAGAALRVGRGCIGGHPVMVVEPQTFMNCSGTALAQLPREADDALVVVHDDLDLPAGQLRVRRRGGSGGHHGVASIVEQVGPAFARVRVGIDRPPEGADAAAYVLAPLSAADLAALRAGVERAGDAVESLIIDGVEAAMSRFNVRAVPDKD
jgi:peptidyl-tRNA hydrolase, PTH1 family